MTGSSITMCFHSRWGKKTYLKAQKCWNFHRRVSLHDCMFKLIIIHIKAKAWVFPYKYCSYFISCGFAYCAKSWIQLQTNTVHYHFCFLKSRQLPEFKSHLKVHWSSPFSPRLKEGKVIHQKGLRAPFTLIFHSEATFLSIYAFLFIWKAKEEISPF